MELLLYVIEPYRHIEETPPFYILYSLLELTNLHQYWLDIPISSIVLGSHSWSQHNPFCMMYQGAKLSNGLPEHIKGAETVGQFQSYINIHLLLIVFMSCICKNRF